MNESVKTIYEDMLIMVVSDHFYQKMVISWCQRVIIERAKARTRNEKRLTDGEFKNKQSI